MTIDFAATVCHLKEIYLDPSMMIIEEINSKLYSFTGSEIMHEVRESSFKAHILAKTTTSFHVDVLLV